MAPRWRLPLLVLGFISLAFGVSGGLARLAPSMDVLPEAIALHGALMVCGFFGTVIALERAVALGKLWAYAAPLAAGLGGALLLFQLTLPGLVLMVLAAAVLATANLLILARHPSLEMATLVGGAAAWLAGNVLFIGGLPGTYWWIAFFALTIGGERLELSRYLRRAAWTRNAFAVLAGALLATTLMPRAMGAVLLLLSLWLFAFDLARVTVRQTKLPRYIAVCLLAGYFWLGLGGLLILVDTAFDGALHAIFLGFVFSMVMGHAPVILPAVLRAALPYSVALYAPLGVLHASVAVRVIGDFFPGIKILGAWGNAAAIALFIVTAAALVLSRASSGRQTRSAPGR
ncbi:MAG TPA: hypothetical protein VN929_01640 [Burkholderiales bacterium]|nr:hypothetical protein [Burkholderiales bacterium]